MTSGGGAQGERAWNDERRRRDQAYDEQRDAARQSPELNPPERPGGLRSYEEHRIDARRDAQEHGRDPPAEGQVDMSVESREPRPRKYGERVIQGQGESEHR